MGLYTFAFKKYCFGQGTNESNLYMRVVYSTKSLKPSKDLLTWVFTIIKNKYS